MMPLGASALMAGFVVQTVSKERLYHVLPQGFCPATRRRNLSAMTGGVSCPRPINHSLSSNRRRGHHKRHCYHHDVLGQRHEPERHVAAAPDTRAF